MHTPTPQIVKNGLTFTASDHGYLCHELASLDKTFAERHSPEAVELAIAERLKLARGAFHKHYPSPAERDLVPETERARLGGEVFDRVVAELNTEGLSLMQRFLLLMGDNWHYFHPTVRADLVVVDSDALHQKARDLLRPFLLDVLPDPVREVVGGMTITNVAVSFGHFAILFRDEAGTRRIVTDRSLYEIADATGYNYLDVDQAGNPIARFCTSRSGNRGFFDGIRLMAHPRFQTCAPKTVLFDAGYKFNSTGVSVVNGALYPLIDADDAVAKTTGAFMGLCEFSNQQAIESYALSEESARRLVIEGDVITLDGRKVRPLGHFAPSRLALLESGFTRYEWSDFHESGAVQYDHVMAVDDNEEWLAKVEDAFGANVNRLTIHRTTDAEDAIAKILELRPEAIILDVHLTSEERFEGLYVANQLAARGFTGRILIASSYGDEALATMGKLIKTRVWLPGKNLERIRQMLGKLPE